MSGLDTSQLITDEETLERGGEHQAAVALDEEMARRGVSTPRHPFPESADQP
jgi:hypothetical protein